MSIKRIKFPVFIIAFLTAAMLLPACRGSNNGVSPTANLTPTPGVSTPTVSPDETENSDYGILKITSDLSLCYEYTFLDEYQREAYISICEQADAWVNSDNAGYKFTVDGLPEASADSDAIIYALRRDNPLLWSYLSGAQCVYDGQTQTLTVSSGENPYYGNVTQVRKQIYEVNNAADTFLAEIDLKQSDYEIYRDICFMLSSYISYNFPADGEFLARGEQDDCTASVWVASSVYGGLINHSTICYGYAESFQFLCHRVGLWCTTVNGTGMNLLKHRWNVILLDDGYYHTDVTWTQVGFDTDDLVSKELLEWFEMYKYRYLCLTDEQVLLDHIFGEEHIPICAGEKYNYDGPT